MPKTDITVTHPKYRERLPYWLEAFDFYRGGRAVLFPGRAVGRVYRVGEHRMDAMPDGAIGGEEAPRRQPLLRDEDTTSYLYSHVRESRLQYLDRVQKSVHFPLFRHVGEAFTSATLRTDPTYANDALFQREPWKQYRDNVDRRGTNFPAFVRQALGYALAFGVEHAITDKPSFDEKVDSRAQQLARGERAYSYLVHPLDLVDWQLDDDSGQFVWIKVREDMPVQRGPVDPFPDKTKSRYRVWTRDSWQLWEPPPKNSKQWVVTGDDHDMGEVPIASLFARRSHESRYSIDADSMIADALYVDRDLFNDMSLIREQVYAQGFYQLFLPDDGSNQWNGVDIGVAVAIPYNSEHGQPLMLGPRPDLMLGIFQLIGSKAQLLKQLLGLGRGKAEYSKEERSAEALSVESRNENNQVSSLAEAVEEFDRTLHRHASILEGEATHPEASYSRDVSLRSIAAQISDVAQLKNLGAPPATLVEMMRPLVTQVMREQGATSDSISKAINALEEGLEAATEAVPGEQGQAEDDFAEAA